MGRSVVLAGTGRCPFCQLAARWCVCDAAETASCTVGVRVLMHRAEQWRPSSTGHLVARVVAGAQVDVFDPLAAAVVPRDLPRSDRLWVLHPQGEDARVALAYARPEAVLVLDGTWAQSGPMLRMAQTWGRPVRLPMAGASRYWLRSQSAAGGFSTAEAVISTLELLDETEAALKLRRQFELRVYAGLLSRGRPDRAADYLRESPAQVFTSTLRRLSGGRSLPREGRTEES